VHDTRRTRLVLGVLIVVALLLITIDYRDGGSPVIRGIRAVSTSVFGGAETAANSASSLVGQGQGGSAQVRSLQQEVIRLRAQLSHAQLSQAQYGQLRRLLSVAGKGGYRVVAATVIATGQGFQQTVTLDAGSRDGVRARETVLNGQGLVGEVTAVGPDTCTVMLATDSSAQVGIELAPGGQLGWVAGPGKTASGTAELKLQVLDTHVTLTPGQQLVTSASVHDRPYVPGVPVGTVSRVVNRAGTLTSRALVRPYVNFAALGVVGIVIEPPKRSPRFSVLPPRPHAKPTPTVTVTVTPGARRSPGSTSSGTPASPATGG
jgi:rod shape-determining protein MreC